MTEIPSMALIQDDDRVCLNIKKVTIIPFTSRVSIYVPLLDHRRKRDRSRDPGEKQLERKSKAGEQGSLKMTLQDYGQIIVSGYYKLPRWEFYN